MNGIWGSGEFHFNASTQIPVNETFDYCIITSKSMQTRDLCLQAGEILRHTEVVSLQNGIGNEEIISEFTDNVIGGTVITGFEWRDDASVEVTVEAGPIRLGRFPAGTDEAVERLVALFADAGMKVEGSKQIRTNLWSKTLYNCALNPLGAIMDVPYGELAESNAWSLIKRIIREAFAVCRAQGIALPWDTPAAYLDYLKQVQLPATANHHSSMLQDIRGGRETEIDFINGAVVRLAKEYDLDAPTNRDLVDMIRFKCQTKTES
jgi:2-dehydropantoate 2-reductase